MQNKTVIKEESIELSRTMRAIIDNIIQENGEAAFDENQLLFLISDYFIEKFPGNKLEYQLKRMKMETTADIKRAISIYMTRYFNIK
jgi:hypothetical protein